MEQKTRAKDIDDLLVLEMHAYKKAFSVVSFAIYVLPLLALAGVSLGLLELWLQSDEVKFYTNLSLPIAVVVGAYAGYVGRCVGEAIDRAASVSCVKELAYRLGYKVVLRPSDGEFIQEGLRVVEAIHPDKGVQWQRDWRRWDCLAEFVR